MQGREPRPSADEDSIEEMAAWRKERCEGQHEVQKKVSMMLTMTAYFPNFSNVSEMSLMTCMAMFAPFMTLSLIGSRVLS